MRQGQQNRRGRGRNRKGQSPLTRSFESTGPDVKIRGTPSHIAEKYMSLARDATSSGDPVLAENYLQHAEHYNRIIMAFRDQQISQGGGDMMNGGGMPRQFNDMGGDDFGDDEGDDGDMQPHQHQPQPQQMRHDHQPRGDGQRFEGHRGGSQDQNRHRGDRDHHRNNNRFDRGDRGDRHDRGERHDRGDQGGQPRPPRMEAEGQQPAPEGNFQRRDRFPQQQHEQPEFLRRPVRRPRREGNGAPGEVNGAGDDSDRE
jgi:hypothetical protein